MEGSHLTCFLPLHEISGLRINFLAMGRTLRSLHLLLVGLPATCYLSCLSWELMLAVFFEGAKTGLHIFVSGSLPACVSSSHEFLIAV